MKVTENKSKSFSRLMSFGDKKKSVAKIEVKVLEEKDEIEEKDEKKEND